jgi:hypothetical protein
MEPDYKKILLQFIASLTLSEDQGEIEEDIAAVFDAIDMDIEWDDLDDLGRKLGKMGITTLYGSSLEDDFEEENEFEEWDEDKDFEVDDDED